MNPMPKVICRKNIERAELSEFLDDVNIYDFVDEEDEIENEQSDASDIHDAPQI